ncbi:MATE family efflux transporter [Chloroflexota bacterium]
MKEERESTDKRDGALEKDWTKGSIVRNLLSLSWPMMINEGLWAIGFTIDMIWIGKLGPTSIAGAGVAGIIVMIMMTAIFGLSVGTKAMIARFVGGEDTLSANHVAQQSFVITGIITAILAVIGFLFSEHILSLFGLSDEVVAEGTAYLQIQFVGSVPMAFWIMAENIMYATGDGVNPMRITLVARFVHAVLTPFLVLGWWIFPQMGVSGAALSNLLAFTIGMTFGLWILFSGRTRLTFTLRNFVLDFPMIWRIVKIAIPASVMGLQRSLGQMMLMRFMVPFGTLAVAAHSLIQRVDMFLFLPSMGLGVAGGVLVGQNLGARQPDKAAKSAWLATGLAEALLVVCAVLILLFPEKIIGIFTVDSELIELTRSFLRIAVTGYLLIGFVAVMQHCISGAGDTFPPMLISLIMVWVVQLPLAFIFSKVTNLGELGIRWAMVTGTATGAISYTVYFWTGRWKRKNI